MISRSIAAGVSVVRLPVVGADGPGSDPGTETVFGWHVADCLSATGAAAERDRMDVETPHVSAPKVELGNVGAEIAGKVFASGVEAPASQVGSRAVRAHGTFAAVDPDPCPHTAGRASALPERPQSLPGIAVLGLATWRGQLQRSLQATAPDRGIACVAAVAEPAPDAVGSVWERRAETTAFSANGFERGCSLPSALGSSQAQSIDPACAGDPGADFGSLFSVGDGTPATSPDPHASATGSQIWMAAAMANARMLRVLNVAMEAHDLGRVDLRLTLDGSALTVELAAADAGTAQLLRAERDALVLALVDAGYELQGLLLPAPGSNRGAIREAGSVSRRAYGSDAVVTGASSLLLERVRTTLE